jgi:TRAP-type C4-dicarboxylate transport system permease small subunit
MPLSALGVTALLTGLDWGAWDWASNTGHATLGVIAAVLLVPAAVAFTGFLAITVIALARIGAEHAAARRRARAGKTRRGVPTPALPLSELSSPSPAATPRDRIAS